ncbi:MAG TPA: hypothetical protein DDY77_00785 [Clostridiales bacterium]|nr:hypothetical protein [Clostridiales bacterium]
MFYVYSLKKFTPQNFFPVGSSDGVFAWAEIARFCLNENQKNFHIIVAGARKAKNIFLKKP